MIFKHLVKEKVQQSCYSPCRCQGGEEIKLLLILYLGTIRDKRLASRPGCVLPRGKNPRYPLVGLRNGLDIEARAGVGNLFMLEGRINLAVIK
jgi:hypothetical protein